jgi:hypothetical protein
VMHALVSFAASAGAQKAQSGVVTDKGRQVTRRRNRCGRD